MANFSALKQTIQNYIKQNGNKEITGNLLQTILLSMVTTMGDGAINDNASDISDIQGDIQNIDGLLNAFTTRLNNGALYAGYATPSTTPAALTSQKVFYLATQAGTYTHFHFNGGNDPIVLTKDGIYFIVSGDDDDDWNAEPILLFDDKPTALSTNAVKSGGVAEELALGAVYDVSAKNPTDGPNSDGKWESLSALLSDANLNTLIPTSVRKGGMSIKFVCSSDNKYRQFMLMDQEFTTDTTLWAACNDGVYVENPEYIDIEADADNKILEATEKDGSKHILSDLKVDGTIKNLLLESLNRKIEGITKVGNVGCGLFDSEMSLVLMYGQSYCVARDGGYNVSDNDNFSNIYQNFNNGYPDGYSAGNDFMMVPESTINPQIEFTILGALRSLSNLLKHIGKKQDFFVANAGLGSRSIKELMKNNGYDPNNRTYHQYEYILEPLVSNIVASAHTNNKTISCPVVLWLQGESDVPVNRSPSDNPASPTSSCKGDKNEYKECFLTLKQQITTTIMGATGQTEPPIFILYTCGNGVFNEQRCGIAEASLELADENDDIFCIGPYYHITSDGPHLSPDGRRWLGEIFAKHMYSVMVNGEDDTMNIDSCSIAGNKLVIGVKTPCAPLVADTYTVPLVDNYGFDLFVLKNYSTREKTITIKSVELKGNKIVITTDEPNLAYISNLFIAYANSTSHGLGNIRDSDTFKSCDKYETNDLGSGQWAMAQLTHIPYDEEGNILIGSKYPMWNFLPPFGFYVREKLV